MAVTISLFDHTARKFADGSFAPGGDFRVNLYLVFSYDATATTKAAAETGATQVSTGGGYVQNSYSLTNVTTSTVTTNDARLDADDAVWSASGDSIPIAADAGGAVGALLYLQDGADNPPVAYIDFGASESAADGTDFKIIWDPNGIVSFTVT